MFALLRQAGKADQAYKKIFGRVSVERFTKHQKERRSRN